MSQFHYKSVPTSEVDVEGQIHLSTTTQKSFVSRFGVPLIFLALVTWAIASLSATVGRGVVSKVSKSSGDDDCPSCLVDMSYCTDKSSPVLGGVDFVDFYTNTAEGSAGSTTTPGSSEYSAVYSGYTFYFLSDANRLQFITNPNRYVPQYGGFCSWGVAAEYCPDFAWSADCLGPAGSWAQGYKYNDRLYFFYQHKPMEFFLEDPATYAAAGAERWASWFAADGKTVFSTNCYVST